MSTISGYKISKDNRGINRILIVAMGRSGGYNLGMWLSKELDYKFIHEPKINNLDEAGYNIVTKYLITEWEVQKNPLLYRYDKIIGLIREGDRECAISQCWAEQKNQWRNNYTITDEWITENESYINEMEDWVKRKRESLLSIKQLGLVVSYEGIYERKTDIQKILNYVGIKETKYMHLMDESNRLRSNNKKPKRLI
jgi:hypothetical protein